jgi:hypothetical protein
MPKNSKYRLSRLTLNGDRDVVEALEELEGYAPLKMEYSLANLRARVVALNHAEQTEARLRRALETASDEVIAAAWALHDDVQGAKDQVVAQYGADSSAVLTIGRKKRSDRKRPERRNKKAAQSQP